MPYQLIEKKLGFDRALPYTRDWSAAADFLDIITSHCLAEKPETIVECSSGLTTLVLSRCCQLNQRGHVYSLENGEEYVDRTRRQLGDFSLQGQVDVVYAPLQETQVNDEVFRWYRLDETLAQLEKIDMLVIDGPPGFIQRHSRQPAVPLLISKLSPGAAVFLDDAAREDEQAIVKQWLQQYPALAHEYIETERGCSVLRLR